MSGRRNLIGALAVCAVLAASQAILPLAAKDSTAAVRLQLFRPDAGAWTPIACGSSIAGVGNVRAVGYATVQGATRIRVGYGAGATTVAEAWYTTGTYSPPAGVESSVVDIVQDLIPNQSGHTFRVAVPGSTAIAECSITATSIPAVTEGMKSPRLPAPEAVDALSIAVTSYKSGLPIPCGTSAPQSVSGRLAFTVRASNDVDLKLNLHMHNEMPLANGPDQDGDPANRRFWEGAFNHLFVPSGGTEVVALSGVNGAQVGRNAFHFGQQAATPEAPTRVHPESVCTITNTG